VRVSWAAAGGIGYAGGAFRLRFDDSGGNFGVADIILPNEVNTERVGINGASTVWSSGRRPRTLDGETGNADGHFRFPPQSINNNDYRAENQGGTIYLTARNRSSFESQIEHAQLPPFYMPTDSTLFVSDASFDLFVFTVRAPLTGRGTVTIAPEMISGVVFTSAEGAGIQTTPAERTMVPASFTYVPLPPTGVVFAIVGLPGLRRRRCTQGDGR
jgi:hypothetical protein